jgi:hypothetical protein
MISILWATSVKAENINRKAVVKVILIVPFFMV